MIYGIFDGCYSDWQCIGYLDNEDDANKYAVSKGCYVIPIKELSMTNEIKNVEYKKHHCIVFDFRDKLSSAQMRNEPDRYEIYMGDIKKRKIQRNLRMRWISFYITHDNRDVAEKIAQDTFYEIINQFVELNGIDTYDLEDAIKIVEEKFIKQ